MNSQTVQLTENWTEIVRLFARFSLGASFLSAVADRFGLWGPHGDKNVSCGDFTHYVEYTGAVTSIFPPFIDRMVCLGSYRGGDDVWHMAHRRLQDTHGVYPLRFSPLLFAMGMATGLGIQTPFDYSVFSAAAAAFLLTFREPDRFTLDNFLNRLRN